MSIIILTWSSRAITSSNIKDFTRKETQPFDNQSKAETKKSLRSFTIEKSVLLSIFPLLTRRWNAVSSRRRTTAVWKSKGMKFEWKSRKDAVKFSNPLCSLTRLDLFFPLIYGNPRRMIYSVCKVICMCQRSFLSPHFPQRRAHFLLLTITLSSHIALMD